MRATYLLFICLFTGCYTDDSIEGGDCKFDNGIHSATVDYYNPDTDVNRTYDLDVEVQDCEVIKISFPKGGWLDESHLTSKELNDEGEVTLTDDRDREFTVHIKF